MKKFRFTLQSVLNVKLSLEKQHMAELGACESRIRLFQNELEEIIDRRERSRREFQRSVSEGLKSPELTVFAIGFVAIREKIDLQRRKIEIAEEEKRRIQSALIKVMQERKMLEKLKEKQIGEYKVLQRSEEAQEIDDFLTNKIHTGL